MEKKRTHREVIILIAAVFVCNAFLYTRPLRALGLPVPYYLIDLIVCAMAVYLLIDFCLKPYWCGEFTLTFLLTILTCAGLYANFGQNGKTRWMAIAADVYTCWRFLIIIFFGMRCGRNFKEQRHLIWGALLWSARLASLVYLGLAGYLSLTHSGGSAFSTYVGEVVMALCIFLLYGRKADAAFMGALCAALLLTGKMTAYGVAAVFLVICVYKWLLKIKHNTPLLLISAAGLIGLGYSEFYRYYLNTGNPSPRLRLLRDAWMLAGRNPPFGVGFAGFCSQAALKWPSPWYEGLSYDSSMMGCTQDSFWACVLGQFGYLGAVLMIAVFLLLLLMCFQQRENPRQFASMYLCVCFFAVYSLGGNAIFTSASIVFLIFGLCYSYEDTETADEKRVFHRMRVSEI